MIRVINGKRYNTDTAKTIYSWDNGQFIDDFRRRDKTLYLTNKGNWFIHHEGGAMTDMAKAHGTASTGSENIEPVSENDAYGFLEVHSGESVAREAIEKHFPDMVEDA